MTESSVTGGTVASTAINVGTGWDTILGGTTAGTNIFSFDNASLTSAGALTVTSCSGCGGGTTLQQAYDSGATIETDATGSVVITETTDTATSADLLQLTANPAGTGTFSGDLLQLTLDANTADSFTGNGLHMIIDQSQMLTGQAILVEDDAAVALFTLSENGAVTLGAASAETTALTITDTDFTNALSVGDNNITGAGYQITSTASGLTINSTSADLALTTTTSGNITATTAAGTGLFNILGGNLKVGNGTPGVSLNAEDAYIEGTLEVDGAVTFDGNLDINAVMAIGDSGTVNANIMLDMSEAYTANTTGLLGIDLLGYATHTATGTYTMTGVYSRIYPIVTGATAITGPVIQFDAQPVISMANAGASLDWMIGYNADLNSSSHTGTLSNWAAFYVDSPTVTGGTLTNNYGIYIEDLTAGATSDYGIYIAGADSYSIYSAADDIYLGMGTSTADKVQISATTNTSTTGVLDIDVTTSTSNHRVIDFSNTMSSGTNTTSYGIYGSMDINNGGATNDTMYGMYLKLNDSNASSRGNTLFGSAVVTSITNDATTGQTRTVYGNYASISDTPLSTAGGIYLTYGGYFSASGNTTDTHTTIGVYATASGGDTDYGLYVLGGGTADVAAYLDNGDTYINFNDTVTVNAVCHSGADIDAGTDAERIIVACNPGTLTDYAEYYPTEEDVDFGDVVVVGSNEVEVNAGDGYGNVDPNKYFTIKKLTKSAIPYDPTVIGVVSKNFGDFTALGQDVTQYTYAMPVAVSGRVPVKVSDENGPIKAGDLLTTSSTAGVAMRADQGKGTTFAKALGSFDGSGTGGVMAFIQLDNRPNLQTALADLDLEALSFATSSQNTTIDTFGNVATAGTIEAANGQFSVDSVGNVTTTGNITTTSQLQGQTLLVTGDAQIGGNLAVNGQVSIVNGQLSVASIQSLESSDLEIRLGDSAGVNSLVILNSIEDQLLTINSAGGATLAADGAYLSIPRGYICIDDDGTCDVTGPVNGTIYADAFVTNSTADLAESFPTTDETIEAGNIVAADSANAEHLVKSSQAYQQTLLGIISTDPGVTLNAGQNEDGPRLALAGRVPTKVSLENGPIKAGDPITSSSTAGVGMRADRAGRIVGIALEPFDGSEISADQQQNTADNISENQRFAEGKIIVFVEPGWYIGSALADNGSIQGIDPPSEASAKDGLPYNLADSQLNPDGTLVNSDLENQNLTADQIRQLVSDEVEKQVSLLPTTGYRLPTTDSIDSPIATDSAQVEATSSSQLAEETGQALDELTDLLSTTNLRLDTLQVLGNSNLAQTQVAGTFSQDGTLVIDYGRQINVLGSTLYLQNDGLAGCFKQGQSLEQGLTLCTDGILVDIGAGAVTIDREGNLEITGTLTAQNIKTKELTIDTSDENAKTVGEAQIGQGQTQVTIFTTAIKPEAKIFVTPTSQTGGKTLYVSAKSEFEGFTVKVDGGQAQGTITFDWLIVNADSQVSQGTDSSETN